MKSEASIKKLLEQRSNLPKELEKWINHNVLITFLGIIIENLKNWRRYRKVDFSRFNGIMLYNWEDILAVVEKNKVSRKK